MTLASVIIPCWNSGPWLLEAVRSAAAQATEAIGVEVVVVDDASTEASTVQALDELRSGGEARVYRQKARSGVQQARNLGAAGSKGEIVTFLDADDVLLHADGRSYIESAAALLGHDPDCAFVHSMSQMFGDYEGLTISSYPVSEADIVRKHHVHTCVVLRREDLQFVEHDVHVLKWQDWAFAVDILCSRWRRGRGRQVGFSPGPHHGYRIHQRAGRLSQAPVSEVEMALRTVEQTGDYLRHVLNSSADDAVLAAWIVAQKPTRLQDLVHMAAFSKAQALQLVLDRQAWMGSNAPDSVP